MADPEAPSDWEYRSARQLGQAIGAFGKAGMPHLKVFWETVSKFAPWSDRAFVNQALDSSLGRVARLLNRCLRLLENAATHKGQGDERHASNALESRLSPLWPRLWRA